MKKIFALAIVLGLAACAPKETPAPAADTTMAAPAADTTMADSTKADSAAPAAPAAQ
jgi:hypothetical protein